MKECKQSIRNPGFFSFDRLQVLSPPNRNGTHRRTNRVPALALLALVVLCAGALAYATPLGSSASESQSENHVLPGRSTEALLAKVSIPQAPENAAKIIVAVLHNRHLFKHVNKKHFLDFATPDFTLENAKAPLEEKLNALKAKENKTSDDKKRINALQNQLDTLVAEYTVYTERYSQFRRRDWPFCLSGEEYTHYRVTDGCTSFSKAFMTIANKLNLFEDMRLLVTACYVDLQDNLEFLGGKELPKQKIDGHQMVLAKWDGKWWLINVTYYHKHGSNPLDADFEILDVIDSQPIIPDKLMHQNLQLPGFVDHPQHHSLVVVAIGKDRSDDLEFKDWLQLMRLSISIPREKFEALGGTLNRRLRKRK